MNLQLRGLLVEKRQKKADLAIRAQARITALRRELETAPYSPLETLKEPEIKTNALELSDLLGEYRLVLAEIGQIERELA